MRIGVDARELCGERTGVGTYLASLFAEWQRMPAALAHRWILYVPEGGRRGAEAGMALTDPFEWRAVPGRAGTWWEQRALAAAVSGDDIDVLFAPGYSAPLSVRIPVVLTVHDVSFLAHPEWFKRREALRRRLITSRSARKARTVITVSRFSRNEIVATISIDPSRIRVIYSGIEKRGSRPLFSSRPPIVLFVGSIFNRRRVPDLIRAFANLAPDAPDARLEIVGANRTHPREDLDALASSLGVAGRVTIRSYVSDAELEQMYEQARVFAFLSEYEGFGFTPLEALNHDVPIVVLDTPVAREIYGDAAVYVAAGDIAATSAAIRQLLEDPAARAEQLARGRAVLDRYSWPTAARETLSALDEAGRCR